MEDLVAFCRFRAATGHPIREIDLEWQSEDHLDHPGLQTLRDTVEVVTAKGELLPRLLSLRRWDEMEEIPLIPRWIADVEHDST